MLLPVAAAGLYQVTHSSKWIIPKKWVMPSHPLTKIDYTKKLGYTKSPTHQNGLYQKMGYTRSLTHQNGLYQKWVIPGHPLIKMEQVVGVEMAVGQSLQIETYFKWKSAHKNMVVAHQSKLVQVAAS